MDVTPGDEEHALVNAESRVYEVLGALVNIVDELPSNIPAWCTDDAVSSSVVPAANCELACTDSWECISSVLPLGDDIFHT